MKKLMLIVFCCVLILPGFGQAQSASSNLLITELQTGVDEFIEIYNPTDETVDLSEYRLEYYSASTTSFGSPFKTFVLSGSLYPDGFALASSTGYLNDQANVHFAKTIADGGGVIRLAKKEGSSWISVDVLGWGTAKLFETSSRPKPGDNKSLARQVVDGQFVDTDNNANDFVLNATPFPESTNEQPAENPVPIPDPDPIVPPDPTPAPDPVVDPVIVPDPLPTDPPPTSEASLLQPYITELLPNPASPLTDADDEYVEIYNPNETAFDLSGYKIQAGNTYSYSYVINGVTIPAKSYMAFYSKDNGLTLSNTSSKVRLLDPSGQTVSETDPYSDADEGSVWQLYAGVWQWSITGTPGVANIQALPTTLSTIKAVTAKKPKATKTATPKATKAKLTSAKVAAAKKTAKKDEKGPTNNFQEEENPQVTHPLMLGGAGLLALSYGVYEYRFELSNYLRRLRGNKIFGGGAG